MFELNSKKQNMLHENSFVLPSHGQIMNEISFLHSFLFKPEIYLIIYLGKKRYED